MELFNNDFIMDGVNPIGFGDPIGGYNPLDDIPPAECNPRGGFPINGCHPLGGFSGGECNPLGGGCNNFPLLEEDFLCCNERAMGGGRVGPRAQGRLGYPGCEPSYFQDPLYQVYGKFNHLNLANCGALMLVFKVFIDHDSIIRGVRFFQGYPFCDVIAGLYSDTGNLLAASCPFDWQECPFNVPFTRHVRMIPGYARIALLFNHLKADGLSHSIQQFCHQFPVAVIPIRTHIHHLPSSLYDVMHDFKY